MIKGISNAGFLRKNNIDFPSKIGFKRASRTDRGVHASFSAFSLKFELKTEHLLEGFSDSDIQIGKSSLKNFIDYEKIIEKINQEFNPNEIQIYGIIILNYFRPIGSFKKLWI